MNERTRTALQAVDAAIFQPPSGSPASKIIRAATLGGLYLAGIAHWLVFFLTSEKSFALRTMNFSAYQWPREYVFLSILQEAVTTRTIPYHIFYPLKDMTRFLGIPDYVTSPQIVLLGVMDIATFVLVNTLLLYTLSFVACLLIGRRYRLSLIALVAMTLLLNFNGNITAQIGAGQYVWTGFFLLPFFCLLVLKLIDGDRSLGISIKLALLLLGLMLQGTYHFYNWSVAFLLLLAVFDRNSRRPALLAIAFSIPLVAYRVLPAAMTFWGAERGFLSGYPTLEDLLAALVVIRRHTTETIGVLHNLAWWEYDFYISLLGLAMVAYFGVYLRVKERPELQRFRFQALDWPMLLMSLFSLSIFFAPIASLPLPLAGAERVSSRFLIIPLLFLVVIAAIRMSYVLPGWTRTVMAKVLALFGVAMLGLSLAMHSIVWRVSVLEASVSNPLDLQLLQTSYNIMPQPDPLYIAVVNGSALISAVAVLLLLGLWVRESMRAARIR